MIKNSEIKFDSFKALWLFLYFSWLTSIFSWFIKEWNSWALNLSYFLEKILGVEAMYFIILSVLFLWLFSIFGTSLFSIFKSFSFEREIYEEDKPVKNSKNPEVESLKKDLAKMAKELQKQQDNLEKEKEILEREKEQIKARKDKQMSIKEVKISEKPETSWDKKSIFWLKRNIEIKDSNEKPKLKSKSWKWVFPSIDLLQKRESKIRISEADILRRQSEIKDKLSQFKIEVEMWTCNVWPTVVQYRLKPSDWVKLNRIENLKKDLTLALHAKSIRIQAPIPGEWVVWIEVPNEKREMVWLREIIDSKEFNNPKLKLPFSLWKDVSGDLVVWDLTKMPHLLVAWQTASWKSVWMNGFLISLLYKYSPTDLKFIMIDPKMVELSVYNWVPHLLTPVITNPDKASNALKWCVAEMLRRYDLQREVVARNVEEYNDKVDKDKRLPYIVIVIDELADLMMSWNKKEVENSIARIAQMARAVWMHLIVATQRPSVDVITGLIKANIPSRIAFTVASQIDSRTVIDKGWAEDLLWMWDMLYYPTWASGPQRIQWVFVDTAEVESIVKQIKLTPDPDWWAIMDTSIVNWKSAYEGSVMEGMDSDYDEDPEIIEKAIKVVREAKKGSTSLVQRKLWLWYARAAKVLDILEELWIVWPPNGSKPRDVYE